MSEPTKQELLNVCVNAAIIALAKYGDTKLAAQIAMTANSIMQEPPTNRGENQ